MASSEDRKTGGIVSARQGKAVEHAPVVRRFRGLCALLFGMVVLGLLFVGVPPVRAFLSLGFGSADAWAHLPVIRPDKDTNKNGVNDADDFIAGGRAEVARMPLYRSAYYRGGYPPPGEGVCTDLIWRAFQDAGYNLKSLVDADIRRNPGAYPRAGKAPDPHIDFRRVPNLTVFFKRYGKSLTTVVEPGKAENLAKWQGGDIVVFKNPDHIAILSDTRNADGIPLLLHNQGPWATEGDDFMAWYKRGIVAHFRYP